MALNIAAPFIHVEDTNGNPYVGAQLYVYEAGTTTLASIYSNDGLSTPVANPLTADSAGNFPRAYIASGTYKLRAETSSGSLIWEYDNIDTGLPGGTGALPISRGGTGATTAPAALAALGAASQDDVTDLASDIADLSASISSIVSSPQGYLTPTSGTPVIASNAIAATAVYYTPFVGSQVPLYNGSIFTVQQFSELTLTLNSNHVADEIYDVFVWSDGGTLRLVTGPAWNTATAGSGSRGTGAGTTELTRLSGILVNAFAMTGRNGASTYAVAANQATYVGSLLIDGTNGQVTCHVSFGQNRKWGIWNAYNRRQIVLQAGDSTTSWTYATNTWRASNNDSDNSVTTFCGLAEEMISVEFVQNINLSGGPTSTVSGEVHVGIGKNSTSSPTGFCGLHSSRGAWTNGSDTGGSATPAKLRNAPELGANVFTALEITNAITGATATYYGGNDDMIMTAVWMG